MDIDLRDRGISRLCFSAEETSEEESNVASAVSVLLADRNQIDYINGLDGVFVNLVELRLSHNRLGRSSTPYYRINQSVLESSVGSWQCCDGVASWIRALPPTLEVLDVAYNHLHSFLECTCVCADSGAPGQLRDASTALPTAEQAPQQHVRALRHSCPLAMPLFFAAERFPRLRELHLSHNAFAVSLRESDEMQHSFESSRAALSACGGVAVAASESLALLDLSFNEGVAAVNSFFLSTLRSTGDTNDNDGDNGSDGGCARSEADATRVSSCAVNLTNTAVEDLQGIAAIGLYRPSSRWSLRLHPCPLSRSVLSASTPVLVELLHMVVTTLVEASEIAAALLKPTSVCEGDLTCAMDGLQSAEQLAELAELVKAEAAREAPDMAKVCSSREGERWVAAVVYACLLHQVVPSLENVDVVLPVACCETMLLSSLQRLLAATPSPLTPCLPTSRLLPMGAPPPLHPQPPSQPSASLSVSPPPPPPSRGLGSAASAVAPELRSRVVVGHSSDAADTTQGDETTVESGGARSRRFQAALAALRPSQSGSATPVTSRASSAHLAASAGEGAPTHNSGDFFTPAGLAAEEKAAYEALCLDAQELQAAVLASNERCRDFRSHADALRQQLTQDRTLVADQLKAITRLRQQKEALAQGLERQKRRLEKRQKEVMYGVTAIQSREAAAREKAALERIAAREREVTRRERQLRQRTIRAGALAVEYRGSGPAGQRKKLRSEVLREAAVRKRLVEQENKDPLAYIPAPFKSDARRASPRTSPDEKAAPATQATLPPPPPPLAAPTDEERAYFELYGAFAAPGLQELADQYITHLPSPQQQQLREASAHLLPSGSRDATGSQQRQQRSRESSTARHASLPAGGGGGRDNSGSPLSDAAVGSSPEGGRDLSSLSLSELLDAAAAIRRKQLALQQLQQQWKHPLQPPPRSPSPASRESASSLHSAPSAKVTNTSATANDAAVVTSASSASVHGSYGASSPQLAEGGSESAETATRAAWHCNSPFRSTFSEEVPPQSAQELFDMILAQRANNKKYNSGSSSSAESRGVREGNRGGEQAVPPTRSPFSIQQAEGEEHRAGGTAVENYDKSKNVAAPHPPINRALFR